MDTCSSEDRDLRNECQRVIDEIITHVKSATKSNVLESSYSVVHMNITTKEDIVLCVRLTVRGFEVCIMSPV